MKNNNFNLIYEALVISKNEFKNYMYNGFFIKFDNVEHIIEKLLDEYRGACNTDDPKMTPNQYKKNIELFLDSYFILKETKDHRYDDVTSYMVRYKSFGGLSIPIIVYYKDDPNLFKGEYKFLVKPGALKPRNYKNKNYKNEYITMESKLNINDFDWNNFIEVEI